jgi:hypothetical protein
MLWRLSYSTIGDVLSFVNTHRALGLCTQACRGWRDVASSLITQRYSIESNKVDAVLSLILHISNRMKRSFTTVMPRPSLESWFIQVENSYCPDVEFDDARLQKLATVAHLSPIKSLEWLTQYGLAQYVPFCDSRPCTKRLVLLAVELPTVMVDGSTFGDFGYQQHAWQHEVDAPEWEQMDWESPDRTGLSDDVYNFTFGRRNYCAIERASICRLRADARRRCS